MLIHKLGYKPGMKAELLNAPADYLSFIKRAESIDDIANELDWLQAFYSSAASLKTEIAKLKDSISSDGQLWLSWPKKSSATVTDLSDSVVREVGLNVGLVDIKVVAVDQTWSALKFVYRVNDK